MKRLLSALGYAAAGVVLAVGLTVGAYAIAGRDIAKPVVPVRVPAGVIAPSEATQSPDPVRSVDDKGGERPRTDDNSGSGSSNSGSGSSNSGSGSSNSGSGSDDD